MKISEALARALRAETETVFGLMGDGNVPLWGAMVGAGIRVYASRHEAAAVAMADGYARVNGCGRSLYLASHASQVVGLPEHEGRALIEELTERAVVEPEPV